MPAIAKFNGFLVNADRLKSVVTPAYDALTPAERRAFAEKYPENYVNVMRTLEEFDGSGPTLDELLEHNQKNLARMLSDKDFVATEHPAYYLYQLRCQGHVQTGVIANIPVEEYLSGRLKKHEDTQLEKEKMLTHYQRTVGVTSSPICIAYEDRDDIARAIDEAQQKPPLYKFCAWDDVEQCIWRVDDVKVSAEFERGFLNIGDTYLTDGHHRCASGARIAEGYADDSQSDHSSAPGRKLFVALFPKSQLRIFSYFRCVRDLGELEFDSLLSAITQAGFQLEPIVDVDVNCWPPKHRQSITMLIDGKAFRLQIPDSMVTVGDPVASLDVSILQDRILSPIFGIHDARSDKRLSYTPGVEGIRSLVKRCQQGWRVGFACVDTTIQEVMDVADAAKVMPPKSTWFDPKLRGGIFLQYC